MAISLGEFYKETDSLAPEGLNREVGHFNVFDLGELVASMNGKTSPVMPYDRRAYYKISLIGGRNKAEYADKVIDIEKHALLFATPRIPYHWIPQDTNQSGHFCIFSADFLIQQKSGVVIDELPIFQPGGYPIFQLTDDQAEEIKSIFLKMHKELASDYAYKYDLMRNFVVELIHYGQRLQPVSSLHPRHNAAARVSSLFMELLERQFPIESPQQKLTLRTAGDYADRLSVHVNHLNKALKEDTGKTTTDLIQDRLVQEAKILLRQTNWNVSEIAYTLGFEEVAHFSNFFKKQTSLAPISFRN